MDWDKINGIPGWVPFHLPVCPPDWEFKAGTRNGKPWRAFWPPADQQDKRPIFF
ncbi:hypothetical protein ACFU44_00565 [Nocardia rhizosphaerihabitans]|uniref:hypothetical protein n=1 Tax=Nocardia rhizosphaerihabitans TaxID=1691570 RepID=UPI00366B178C